MTRRSERPRQEEQAWPTDRCRPWSSPPVRAPGCARDSRRCSTRCAGGRCSCTCSTRSSRSRSIASSSSSATAPSSVTKTVQEQLATEIPIEFVEQRVQRGTGDAASVGLTAVRRHARRRRRRDRAGRRHAAAPPRDARRRSPPSTGSPTPRRPCSPPCSTTRRATAGSSATTRDHVERIVEQTDANDAELEITEVNPSIYCFRRSFLAPALRRLEPGERAGRVLPHRRDRGAAPGRATSWSGVPAADADRDARRQRPRPARRGRGACCARASTTGGCAKACR